MTRIQTPRSNPRRAISWLVLLAACSAALILIAPGTSRATTYYGYFEFFRSSNTNSTLVWEYWEDFERVRQVSWRAGSGSTTNECEVGKGLAPRGNIRQLGHV